MMKHCTAKRSVLQYLAIVFLLAAIAESTLPAEMDPFSIVFPYQWVGNIDQIDFKEPSGIVFHPPRGTLFAVGDGGDVCEIHTDGTLVKQAQIRPADFEGITCDPSTGLLYIAIEGEEKILEVEPEDFKVAREFTIDRTFQGKMVLKPGGQGIEGITFVPDPNHPEGGTFYVSNQAFDLADPEEPSAILQVELPLKTGASEQLEAKIIQHFPLRVTDLSGIHYNAVDDRLYVISDSNNIFFELTRTGEVVKSYAFPGSDQEGITIDQEGFLYIAQDSGGIIKIKISQ